MTSEEHAWLAEVHKILTAGLRTGAANSVPAHANQTQSGGVPILWIVRKIAEMQATLAAILAQGVAAANGVTDPADLTAVAEQAAEQALAGLAQEIADAAVAEQAAEQALAGLAQEIADAAAAAEEQ
jgi:hypothetical protein